MLGTCDTKSRNPPAPIAPRFGKVAYVPIFCLRRNASAAGRPDRGERGI